MLGVGLKVLNEELSTSVPLRGQTHFGMPRGARMSMAPTEQVYRKFFGQTSTPAPSMHQKLTDMEIYCMQNNQLQTKNSG